MSDNEITIPSPSNHIDDPADAPHQASIPQISMTDTTTSTASHGDTQAERDVLESHHDDTPADPNIAALMAMFPDYDDSLLRSVLLSVGGDQNSAIEVLLGMSDPQYMSEGPQSDRVQALSQVDLDEQLARRLMLEEQQQQEQQEQQQQQGQQEHQRHHLFPYEPYAGSQRRAPRQQQQPPNSERDPVAEIQDRFGRIAETGKKTFESLFSKVKSKIQEYDKPSNPEPRSQEPQSVTASTSSSQRWAYSSTSVQPQAPYYDPNPPNPSPPPVPIAITKPVPSPMAIKGYDVESEQIADVGSTGPSRSESDPTSGASTPRTSTGSRPITTIDGGKLGLLPKRPVSLLKQQGSESAKEPVRHASIESNDELEYAENPFEESRN